MIGLALQIYRHGDSDIACLFKFERQLHFVAILQGAVEAQEHHMVAAARHHDMPACRQLKPFFHMDHAHDAHIVFFMGVQFGLFRNIRACANQAVGGAGVFDHHKGRARAGHHGRNAGVRVFYGDIRGKGGQGKAGGRDGSDKRGFQRHWLVLSVCLLVWVFLLRQGERGARGPAHAAQCAPCCCGFD